MISLYLICIVGLWFGFANPILHIPPMALLFPAGLILISQRASTPLKSLKSGWLAGALSYSLALYWVVIPVHTYGNIPLFLAIPCPILMACVLGLYTGIYCFLVSFINRTFSPLTTACFASLLWASLEFLRGYLFTGFPWLILLSGFSSWPWSVQIVSLTGAYAASGLFVFPVALLCLKRFKPVSLILCFSMVLLISIYSLWQYNRAPEVTGRFSAGIIQGNIDQSLKWDKAYQTATIDKYISMSTRMEREHDPDLLVWPETAFPFYFQQPSPLRTRTRDFVRKKDLLLFFGSPGYEATAKGYQYFNRAYLLGPDGKVRGVYDKEHLVPFGEYVPFSRFLPFVQKLVAGVGDFSSGVNSRPISRGPLKIGTLICYEAIFPELAQKRVRQGANLLINISNDAWFGKSSAPLQHLHLSALRSVEQNRYCIRATNTGISALISPKGKISHPTSLFEDAAFYAPRVGTIEQHTIFQKIFALVPYLLLAPTLFLLALGIWNRRKNTKIS